jgi:hypothetical protein
MTSTGAINRARELPRNKRVAEVGDWAASAIAWAAMMVMCLAIVWVLLYTTGD